jgi:hypothetical protein
VAADKPSREEFLDESMRRTLRLIAKGAKPNSMLRRLTLDALMKLDRSDRPAEPEALVSDAARSATEWIGADFKERDKGLRELLTLSDALRPDPEPGPSFPEKVSAVHRCLRGGEIPHAIGGALAIGYYGEPRSTLDIDVNTFVPPDHWCDVYETLEPLGIDMKIDEAGLERDGEVKLGWGSNFLHLFFSCDPLHEEMSRSIRTVPFNGSTIPLVSPEHLVVRKALLDRTKDWLDIEQILVATSPLDLQEIERWLEQIAGIDDPRLAKLRRTKSALSLS